MKRALLSFAILSALAGPALSSAVVSLPGRKTSLGTSGELPILIDLTAELQKKKIESGKTRLVQVDVIAKAGPTGAIYALMLSGAAVDSATIPDDRDSTVSLVPDASATPPPWVLGVRGDVDIKEIRLTLESSAGQPSTPPAEEPPPVTTEPPPPVKAEPVRSDDDLVGRRVIVVSRTSGRIDYVDVVRKDRDGTYVVLFQGMEYDGFDRRQIALTEGCSGDVCVGDSVQTDGRKARVLGRLPGQAFVVETAGGERFVFQGKSPQTPPEKQAPAPREPAPAPLPSSLFATLTPGAVVLIVQENSDVFPAQVLRTASSAAWVRSYGRTAREIKVTDSRSIAVLSGCLEGFCVGDPVVATDDRGRRHQAEILGLQEGSRFVLRLFPDGWEIGNWPAHAVKNR